MRQRHARGGASAGFPVLLLMCGIALGGCVTHVARAPRVPDITAVPVRPDAPIIGLARVRDRRLNDVAGYVGDPVVAGAGFVDYLYVSLFKGLYDLIAVRWMQSRVLRYKFREK